MAFFQAQQALGLDTERANTQARTGLHQGVPQAFGMARRHMHFIAQFTDETDPQDARRNASHLALAYAEVGEGFCRQVHVFAHLGQHLA
ncbi:hypothetical protein D3C80_1969300 [compost metagenome]